MGEGHARCQSSRLGEAVRAPEIHLEFCLCFMAPQEPLKDEWATMRYQHGRVLAWCSGKSWDFRFRSGFGFFSAIVLAM